VTLFARFAPRWFAKHREKRMKLTTTLAVAVGLAALAACRQTPQENAAENIEANAENVAENIEANAANLSENIQANAENAAENVQANAENAADTVRNTGNNAATNSY
jgi:hypothetical protein